MQNLSPDKEIEVNATVKDMILYENSLLIATDNGLIKIYDTKKEAFTRTIKFHKVKDFMGDEVSPRVFSVDRLEHKILALSESGKGGYANLWIEENQKLTQILVAKDKISAIKARFVDEHHILLGLLSNEALLLDIRSHQTLFRTQLSPSKFSDFTLNEDKTKAVFACESGVLSIIDSKIGKILKNLKNIHVDNVYKVDFKQGFISGAGQDRKASIINTQNDSYSFIPASFLIYATALSPLAEKVAFAMDEENNISIYERQSQNKIAILKGQKSTLNTILFKDENTVFSSSDDSTIMLWKLK